MLGAGMKILGIETSCDETAASVVEDGRRLLSNVIASQVKIHSQYGGVVPEVASRQHVIDIAPTVERALEDAGVSFEEVDAVAVTHGPGLAGALLVGVNFAKSLALSLGVPFLGVNHLEGHIYAAWLHPRDAAPPEDPAASPGFPLVCLIASGGHTDLVLMEGHGEYRLLGRTRDDAAGEAFDKAARILGLGFPGGPEIQKASEGALGEERLPRAWLRGSLDFSFSGVKTALLHMAQAAQVYPDPSSVPADRLDRVVRELSAAFQESVVDVAVRKTLEAAEKWGAKGIVLGGGVTANALLRKRMSAAAPVPALIPSPVLCTDNGAMIAACARFQMEQRGGDPPDIDVDPGLSLG